MKIIKFESREEWLNWRLGKGTGSKLKDIVSWDGRKGEYKMEESPKSGEYRLAVESLIGSWAIADDVNPEKAHERGTRLEPIAISELNKRLGKKMVWHNDDIGWESDDDSRIALSPDASQGAAEAAEAKCLSAVNHLEVIDTGEIPREYRWQTLMYFVVNKKLRKLFVVFYDDRFPKGLDFYCVQMDRKSLKAEIGALEDHIKEKIARVRTVITRVSQKIEAQPAQVARERSYD